MELDDREKAFEQKFQHDEELRFKIQVRRAKMFGLWVAEQIGLKGDDADEYGKKVVQADLAEPGVEDIMRKVQADLSSHDVDISEHRLRKALDEFLEKATESVMSE